MIGEHELDNRQREVSRSLENPRGGHAKRRRGTRGRVFEIHPRRSASEANEQKQYLPYAEGKEQSNGVASWSKSSVGRYGDVEKSDQHYHLHQEVDLGRGNWRQQRMHPGNYSPNRLHCIKNDGWGQEQSYNETMSSVDGTAIAIDLLDALDSLE